MRTENVYGPTWNDMQEKDKHIASLESKLALAHKELAEIRAVHQQMLNGIRDLGKKLIEDTVG